MTVCNDGTTVTRMGFFIGVSNGDNYTFTGSALTGRNGFEPIPVYSKEEAEAIVVGMHGGKKV